MSRVHLIRSSPGDRSYAVAYDDPLIVFPRRVACIHADQNYEVSIDWENRPVELREFTISSPEPMANTYVVPPSGIYGSGTEGVTIQAWASTERMSFEEILAEIGVTEVIDEPLPVDPESLPHVMGAVPTEADLPEDFKPMGVYLVRENGTGYCNGGAGEGWQSMRWTPECADAFGVAESEVPDLTVG